MPKKKSDDEQTESTEPVPVIDKQTQAATDAKNGVLPEVRIMPIRDNVLVLPDPDPERTSGGIFIPKSSVELKKFVGTVIAVGEGHMTDSATAISAEFKSIPLRVKRGDRVIYDKYSGSFVTFEEIEYVLLKESNIQAIVTPKSKS
jgi:chaperonin GroES